MTDREKFEAWHSEYASRAPRLDALSSLFDDDKKAFAAWQASRKQMAEEAAAVCAQIGDHEEDMGRSEGAILCTIVHDAIRSLSGGAGPKLDAPKDAASPAALDWRSAKCNCEACVPMGNPFDGTAANIRMIVCATCGNKRCPHATDHRNACTNSNEPGQKGSSWEGVRSLATPTEGKTA